jgi:hypothetical protein
VVSRDDPDVCFAAKQFIEVPLGPSPFRRGELSALKQVPFRPASTRLSNRENISTGHRKVIETLFVLKNFSVMFYAHPL